MAGYLDQYGAGDERRAKIVKRTIGVVLAAIVLTLLPWYLFKNHSQEKIVKNFLALVRQQDYHLPTRHGDALIHARAVAIPTIGFWKTGDRKARSIRRYCESRTANRAAPG